MRSCGLACLPPCQRNQNHFDNNLRTCERGGRLISFFFHGARGEFPTFSLESSNSPQR